MGPRFFLVREKLNAQTAKEFKQQGIRLQVADTKGVSLEYLFERISMQPFRILSVPLAAKKPIPAASSCALPKADDLPVMPGLSTVASSA